MDTFTVVCMCFVSLLPLLLKGLQLSEVSLRVSDADIFSILFSNSILLALEHYGDEMS